MATSNLRGTDTTATSVTISFQMDKLLKAKVARFQKAEWAECYVAARKSAFTPTNIREGWSGSGLFPTDREKILERIHIGRDTTTPPRPSTPTTPTNIRTLFETSLI